MFGFFGLGPVDLAILGGLGVTLLIVVASTAILLTTRNRKPRDGD